jgi:4'-phosphopantetheinyl transferase
VSGAVIDAGIGAPARRNSTPLEVWVYSLDVAPADLRSLRLVLSGDELDRAARFRFRQQAERFVAARGRLRHILAGLVGSHPAGLRLTYGPWGKPALADESPLRFNLAHSDGLAIVAVAWEVEVGVDIEGGAAARRDREHLLHSFLAPEEARALAALPAAQREVAFLRCWTRKEAYVKALGEGLRVPLKDFAVSLAPEEPARLRWCRHPGELERWTLVDLSELCAQRAAECGLTGAVAAACVEGEVRAVRLHAGAP